MARAIWTGSVSFGLVNVPVGLYSATSDHKVHFHQFEEGTSDRIRYQRVNQRTGDEVDYGDIVKGAEVDDGDYVMLSPEEMESVEPGRSRTIDITDFVEASEIDPIYYQRSYYLAPSDETAAKPYALLVKAMEKAERIGIATFVMRSKQHLAAIRPKGDVLVLETMHFADEVRDPAEELETLPSGTKVSKKDLDMAVNLVTTLTAPWEPTNYRDTYTERVEQLIEAKEKNREVVRTDTAEESSEKVVDLLAALQASVERAKGHKPGNAHQAGKLETREAGAESADDDAAGDSSGERRTKKELYERAQELDVPGRSSMSRDELAAAVAEAEDAGSGGKRKGKKAS